MLAEAGEIGGIMKFILQNRDREVPEDVVLKLRDKHPSPLRELRPRKARYYSGINSRVLSSALGHHWHSPSDYSKEETS